MMPSEINQDPVQGEFFTAASEALPQRFVRESLQNSLDARRGNQPVHVRITFSGHNDACLPVVAARYFEGLKPHLQALPDADDAECKALREAASLLNEPMPWVAVEDFGTTGLEGDIRANDPKAQDNDFWGFFRSVGISPKGEDAAGSWGLGKWVYPDASRINAYFGATQRPGESHTLLMGMAVLRTHTLSGQKHPPYGHFAMAEDARDDEWLPLPVDSRTSPDFVEQAVADFKLDRSKGPGLSVVVPYPKDELTPVEVARAVITQYFLPVVRGELTVEIRAPGEQPCTIRADTINRELAVLPKPDTDVREKELPSALAGALRLARWTLELDDRDCVSVSMATDQTPLTLPDLTVLRERYERNEQLVFNIETITQRKDAVKVPASFRLYLERDDTLARGHDYFVRGHLNIPRMNHIQHCKARALVVVDGKSDLGHLLRDSEGPAHVRWDPHAQRLKDRWRGGYTRVQTVRRAAVLILQRLTDRPNEQQLDALADLFPSDATSVRGRKTGKNRRHTQPTPPPSPPPQFSMKRTEGGFCITARQGAELVNSDWVLRFAYDVARGNAFNLFDKGARQGVPDFSVLKRGQIEINSRHAKVEKVADNEVHFRVRHRDCRIDVTGLDKRDMIVDLQPLEAASDAGNESP